MYDTIQSALTCSIEALALGFTALLLLDYFYRLTNPAIASTLDLQVEPATFSDDYWMQLEAKAKRPTWKGMSQIFNFEQDLLLPPAPSHSDLAALNLPKLKALAKGKITGASRLKKQQLILALMEAQITRKDLAAVRAA